MKRGVKKEEFEEESKKDINKGSENDNDESGSDDEETLNWWEQEQIQFASRGEKRWDTLEHNGVMFPPEYVPHGIALVYEGKEFKMTPEEEEVATMFAVMKEHDYYRNEIFRQNFFRSWREILDQRVHPIRRLELCDFEPIYQWHLREREKKLSRTKEEKKQAKLDAEKEAETYRYCLWNGRKEQVANFRVEPPGLFRGRGKHPLMGKLKQRVRPEDITINIGESAPVPQPPKGHKWAAIQHDHTVTWLAMWRDSVLGSFKYVMLAPSSSVKGQSDMMKFEKARKLKDYVDHIRSSYTKDFDSDDLATRQRAVAMYFIDKLALRVGNEKGSDEADTVGCCSLRVEHIQLAPGCVAKFDFLGKDSIRYQNDLVVHPKVHALLKEFVRNKRHGEDIFHCVTPTNLNDHLKSFMPGLSAKVFRTYNASITLDRWFREKPVEKGASLSDLLAYFNRANTEVAILCNHQKSVSKGHRRTMDQLQSKANWTRMLITQLEKAAKTARSVSLEAAAKEFFEEQDRIQFEWLDAYGTPEQRQEYEELVKRRSVPREKSSSKSKERSSGKSKKSSKSSKSSSSKAKKAASKSKKKTSSSKTTKKTAARKISEDEPLINVVKGKSAPGTKAAPKKQPRGKVTPAKRPRGSVKKAADSSDDDDDIPIGSL